jgi:Flp pilus assembly pilin Flp
MNLWNDENGSTPVEYVLATVGGLLLAYVLAMVIETLPFVVEAVG